MQENTIYKRWTDLNIFNRTIEANKSKPTFVFYDGPPFAKGLPHYGHILAGFIKDSILRFNHEQGCNVPRFAGFDQHGLPIEYEIEKELGIKTTQQVLDYGIKNYNRECKGIVLKYAREWEETMGRLGRWIDFKNQYQTMSKEFMNSVWWVFAQLYKKNRVYEGVRIMPYSTACGTPLSNFETQQNYKEVQDDSLFIKLSIKIEGYVNTWIMVWTTTPWTLPSNYALCVGPDIIYDLVQFESDYYVVAHDLVLNVFKNALEKSDVVISTGGVSMGDRDLVKDVLEKDLNCKIHSLS
jgi:isoleucyl-tRNA synthetase